MDPKYAQGLRPGSVAVLAEGMEPEAYGLAAAVLVQRPRLAMAGLTRAFDPGPDIAPGIHPTAVIDDSAELGEGAAIAVAMIPFLLAAILFSFFGLQRRKWQQGND